MLREKYVADIHIQDLQNATASEPLSLEDEYGMQKSWREDHDKLTFIATIPPNKMFTDHSLETLRSVARADEVLRMFGDINLFIVEVENEDGDIDLVGELEVMIARKDMQGRGYGKALLKSFIWYVLRHHDRIMAEYSKGKGLETVGTLKYLHCKIGDANDRSIGLFESVGFQKMSEQPNYFGELELRWDITLERTLAVIEEGEALRLSEEIYGL